jgi:sulfur carrier protein
VQVWINGKPRELADDARVPDALTLLGVPQTGVAVAVDGAVVPRAAWPDAVLTDGGRLEVLTAVQGG